jgi:hypothetical protein
MRTDELFYDLFKLAPESLFELVRLEMKGQYEFESITVKDTERRIDGFAWRVDGTGPNVFLEVQGYSEPKIYWKTFREVSSYYESGSDTKPFVIIILFIDKEFDPGNVPLNCNEPNRLVRAYLPDCLQALENKASALTVLKPLIFNKKKELPGAVKKWTDELKSIEGISQSDYRL